MFIVADASLHGAAAVVVNDGIDHMVYAMPTQEFSYARHPRDLRPARPEPEAEDLASDTHSSMPGLETPRQQVDTGNPAF